MIRRLLILAALLTWSLPVHANPGGASGPITVDSTTFVPGSSVMGTDGGVYGDTIPALSSTTTAAFRMTSYRAEHVNLRDLSGNAIGTISNPLYTTASTTLTLTNVTVTNSSFSVTGSAITPIQSDPTKLNATVIQGTGSNLRTSTSIDGSSNTVKSIQSGTWNVNSTSVNIGTVTISGTSNVAITNTPTVTIGSALPGGTNNIGLISGSTVTVRTATGNNLGVVVNNTVGTTLSASLPSGTNNVGTVSGSTVTIAPPTGTNLPVALITALPAGSNVIGQVTVQQPTPTALKASVLIDGSSNTVVANQGATPYTVNITKINGSSFSGSSIPVTGSFNLSLSSNTAGVASYQAGVWSTTISGTPSVSISGPTNVNSAQSGTWTNTVIQSSPNNLRALVSIDSSSNTIVANQGNAPWSQNITEINGNAISGSSLPVTGSVVVTQSSPTASITAYQGGLWNNTVAQGTNANLRTSTMIDGSSNTVTLGAGTSNIGKIAYQTPSVGVLSSTGITTNVAISTPIAGVTSQTVRVFRMVLTADSATTINFRDGSINFGEQYPISANGSIVLDFTPEPWYVTSASNGFVIKQSGTANLGIRIWYVQS